MTWEQVREFIDGLSPEQLRQTAMVFDEASSEFLAVTDARILPDSVSDLEAISSSAYLVIKE